MQKLTAIVIDDEIHSIESLIWELEPLQDQVTVVGTTTDPREGLALLRTHTPDLVFLDIEMPGMNGFEMLGTLDHIAFDIIFTTAYDQFALRAFEINATDYLLKPVSEDALRKAISKVQTRKIHKTTVDYLADLLRNIATEHPELRKVALPTLEGLLFIRIEEIVRCESESNYTHVHTIKGERFMISRTMKEIEEMIRDTRFLRVHHSHLVNLSYVREYHKGKGGSLLLEDRSVIPVSRHRKHELLDKF